MWLLAFLWWNIRSAAMYLWIFGAIMTFYNVVFVCSFAVYRISTWNISTTVLFIVFPVDGDIYKCI